MVDNGDTPSFLVGGIPTPLKNMKSVGMIIPNIWKNKNCSKPPTSFSSMGKQPPKKCPHFPHMEVS